MHIPVDQYFICWLIQVYLVSHRGCKDQSANVICGDVSHISIDVVCYLAQPHTCPHISIAGHKNILSMQKHFISQCLLSKSSFTSFKNVCGCVNILDALFKFLIRISLMFLVKN